MRTEDASVAVGTDAAPPILISLSAFGAAEVRRHGQRWFTELSLACGADGVEVRSELLVDPARELSAIAKIARLANKDLVYSSAQYLWTADGELNVPALELALTASQTLEAPRLKMAIGGFGADSYHTLDDLQARLLAADIELLIENDQTPAAGTLSALQNFFASAQSQGIFLGMTFDIGNWHWTGECPLQAAAELAPQVRYVHCKGVQREPKRWVAVPLAESSAPWRTVLRALPADVPWAIEFPFAGDDLQAVVQREIEHLRGVAASQSEAVHICQQALLAGRQKATT